MKMLCYAFKIHVPDGNCSIHAPDNVQVLDYWRSKSSTSTNIGIEPFIFKIGKVLAVVSSTQVSWDFTKRLLLSQKSGRESNSQFELKCRNGSQRSGWWWSNSLWRWPSSSWRVPYWPVVSLTPQILRGRQPESRWEIVKGVGVIVIAKQRRVLSPFVAKDQANRSGILTVFSDPSKILSKKYKKSKKYDFLVLIIA